jgi:hypothetical protein
MLENQLFAPALKGVIDFGCPELEHRCALFFAHFRVRGQTKNRSEVELGDAKINKTVYMISNNQLVKSVNGFFPTEHEANY